jgi:hypothetical protein
MWSGLNANLHGGEQRGVLAADHARREGSPDQRFRSADAQRRMDMRGSPVDGRAAAKPCKWSEASTLTRRLDCRPIDPDAAMVQIGYGRATTCQRPAAR